MDAHDPALPAKDPRTESRKTEAWTAERSARDLIRYGPALMYEIDFRGPRFTCVSDLMCAYVEYTHEEMLAMNPFDLMDDAGKATFRKRIEDWLKGEKPDQTVEYHIKTKSGRELDVILQVSFTCDEQGQPVGAVAIGQDITERKRIERTLENTIASANAELARRKQAEEAMRSAALFPEQNPFPVLRVDARGTLLYGNAGAASLLAQWNCDIGRSVPDTIVQMVKESLASRMIREIDIEAVGREVSFSIVPLPEFGYANLYGRDVTERRKAERKVAEQAWMLANVNDAVIGTDLQSRITYWGPGAAKLYGYREEDVLGRSTQEVFQPVYVGESREQAVGRVIRTGSFEVECVVTTKDGRRPTIESHVVVLRDERGEPRGHIAIHRDITDRKQAEDALRESEDRLRKLNESLEQLVVEGTAEVRRQADQLRALASELSRVEQNERKRLATILHDHIQQLLVGAQMQISLVMRGDPEIIQSTVQGIQSTLSEAIAASRSLAVELSPPVLHQSGLTAALSWLATRTEEKHLVKVRVQADSDAEPTSPEVRALLFESVRELLLNAVKHSGTLEAQLSMSRTEDGWTKIVVQDKGHGFDASTIQTRESGGFGLFSIQQRLTYLGGRMDVESAPGKGVRVTLMMPIGEAAAVSRLSPRFPHAGEKRPQERDKIAVLIVDDHKIMRQGLVSLLQFERDIEVIAEAEDGREAVELSLKHRPQVVIMDVNMPVMNGIEATRLLSDQLPSAKVIGLSMHVDRSLAAAMREAGAAAYLTKGGPSEDLIAAIRACGSA